MDLLVDFLPFFGFSFRRNCCQYISWISKRAVLGPQYFYVVQNHLILYSKGSLHLNKSAKNALHLYARLS